MNISFCLTWTLAFLVSLAKARNDDIFGRMECFNTFALAGFDIYDFDSYPEFFTEDSIMQLAETGEYKGPEGIEEYVRYGSPTSPFIVALESFDKAPQVKTASDPDSGECVMLVTVTATLKFTDLAKIDQGVSRVVLLKISFEPTSFNSIAISTLYVHYPLDYMSWFFGDLLNTDQTREYVCNVMKNSCPETWDLNGLSTIEECTNRLSELPAIGDKADVSGKTQGCRTLHSVFAETNPSHCPHISFVEQADPDGEVKCQESRYRPTSEMFDDEDLQVFEEKKMELGLDNDMAAVVCDCSQEHSYGFGTGVARAFNGLASIGPLPETWCVGTIPYCDICNEGD